MSDVNARTSDRLPSTMSHSVRTFDIGSRLDGQRHHLRLEALTERARVEPQQRAVDRTFRGPMYSVHSVYSVAKISASSASSGVLAFSNAGLPTPGPTPGPSAPPPDTRGTWT